MTSGLLYNEFKLSLIVHGVQRRLIGILATLGRVKDSIKSNRGKLAEAISGFLLLLQGRSFHCEILKLRSPNQINRPLKLSKVLAKPKNFHGKQTEIPYYSLILLLDF